MAYESVNLGMTSKKLNDLLVCQPQNLYFRETRVSGVEDAHPNPGLMKMSSSW